VKEISYWFNGFEAFLWSAIAIALFFKSFVHAGGLRKLTRISAVAFLLFGISDLIEMKTGAWWKPTGLLFLKAGCVFTLLTCLVAYFRERKREFLKAYDKKERASEK
jgi:hypothetical protein